MVQTKFLLHLILLCLLLKKQIMIIIKRIFGLKRIIYINLDKIIFNKK